MDNNNTYSSFMNGIPEIFMLAALGGMFGSGNNKDTFKDLFKDTKKKTPEAIDRDTISKISSIISDANFALSGVTHENAELMIYALTSLRDKTTALLTSQQVKEEIKNQTSNIQN
jgi:hypothetical protein